MTIVLDVGGEARQHEAGVAAGGVPGDRAALPARTTDQPRRASSRAAVRPARPPPITQTSTSRSTSSGARAGAAAMLGGIPARSHTADGSEHHISANVIAAGRPAYADARLTSRNRRYDTVTSAETEIPMRRLLLLRHAKAERSQPGQRDRDRVLAERGRNDAPRIGAYLARHGLVPDLRLGVAGGAHARDLGACGRCPAPGPADPVFERAPLRRASRHHSRRHQGDRRRGRRPAGGGPQPGHAGGCRAADRVRRPRGPAAAQRGVADLRPGGDRFRGRRLGPAACRVPAGSTGS